MQQELFTHGGRRKGAGRKPKHGRAGSAHKERDDIHGRDVLHVVLRVVPDVGSLRRWDVYSAIRAASITAARRSQFRIVHLSIQRTHIHMLVEADSAEALASGMHGFETSAARRINTALRVGGRRRRGAVFADRYHVVVIRSPLQVRRVLAYILCNWRKHREDRYGRPSTWLVDPFSSAAQFADWKELEGQAPLGVRSDYDPLVISEPRSWLLRVGWKKHGPISYREVPSQRPH